MSKLQKKKLPKAGNFKQVPSFLKMFAFKMDFIGKKNLVWKL